MSTFLRGVGLFALGTSLCFPFFTKGALESKGLWGIFPWFDRWLFVAVVGSLESNGMAPPTEIQKKKSASDNNNKYLNHYPIQV